MNPIPKTTPSLIIFLSLSAFLCIFVIYPQLISIETKSQEIIFQKNRLSNLRYKMETLREFQILYEKEKSQFKKTEELFFDPEVPIEFIEFLEEETRKSQLKAEISANPPQKIEGDIWASTNFKLTLVGFFSNILKFVEKLESSPWLIEISNLNIRKLTEDDIKLEEFAEFPVGAVEGTLSIKVFSK